MQRIFATKKQGAQAHYAIQTYTVIDLFTASKTLMQRTSISGTLGRIATFVDAPAPSSRTIVLGAQNRNITSGL